MTSMDTLRGDYRFQADFVVDASWRLQSIQDMHPASPSRGCFHYAYWRDKTSEFPDARFQESGATLGLLSLPYFDEPRQQGRLDTAAALYQRFSAGVANLANQQYDEGTFDEWYKGERGFAATEFTTIAYGLATRSLGERVAASDRRLLTHVLGRAAGPGLPAPAVPVVAPRPPSALLAVDAAAPRLEPVPAVVAPADQEACHFLDGLLRCGEADAHQSAAAQRAQPLQRDRQVDAGADRRFGAAQLLPRYPGVERYAGPGKQHCHP